MRRRGCGRGILLSLLVLAAVAIALWRLAGQVELTRPLEPEQVQRSSPVPGALGSGISASSDWYRLYFTAPRYPDDPRNHHGGIDAKLVELIDSATRTVDVADYDFDLMNVAEALARAAGRGVRVRMVTDTDTLTNDDPAIQASFRTLRDAGIPIVDDQRDDLMHNKFTVVDGEWVTTGSWNYTDGDTYRLNNNMIVIHSEDLADNYTAEFEKMFAGREFGPSKDASIPHAALRIGGARVRNCFSPQGGCADLVVEAVNQARQSIDFMAFSFTHDETGRAMMERARDGVVVRGVFETTGSNTEFSEYGAMKDAGLEVYQDGSPWSMHHKVIIIDDRVVVFGSFNFSRNAAERNDENLLIIEDPGLAAAFEVEFDRVLDVARNPVNTR